MRIEHRSEFACSPAALWAWVEEPEKQQQWMEGLLESTPTSEGPSRPGSTFVMKIREGRRVAEYAGEVTSRDEPRHLAVRLAGGSLGGAPMDVDYRFTDLGGRTRLDYRVDFEPQRGKLLFKLLGPLLRSFGRKRAARFFATLKGLVEGQD